VRATPKSWRKGHWASDDKKSISVDASSSGLFGAQFQTKILPLVKRRQVKKRSDKHALYAIF